MLKGGLFRRKRSPEHAKQSNGEVQSQTLGRKKDKNRIVEVERVGNGEMRTGTEPPTPNEKKSRFAAISRFFKPWKWKRRKKPSPKIEQKAVELERKISVRTSRQELIDKGILKEPDESQLPLPTTTIVSTTTIQEVEEGESSTEKQEDPASESGQVPNGSTGIPDGHLPAEEGRKVDRTSAHSDRADGAPIRPADAAPPPNYKDSPVPVAAPRRPPSDPQPGVMEVTMVEPKQIRVMLPMGDADRQLPVLRGRTPMQHPAPQSPKPTEEEEKPNTSPSVTILPRYTTPVSPETNYKPVTPPPVQSPRFGQYEEVPAHEPDISKQPVKSALKGSRQKEELRAQLQEKLRQRSLVVNSPETPRGSGPPKPPPKPRFDAALSVRLMENKENQHPAETHGQPDYDGAASDSDDSEIHYRDDDEDEYSRLASKVKRHDSLALFLSNRPARRDLVDRNIIPSRTADDMRDIREQISIKLSRRLSMRPSVDELEQRNILHGKTPEEYQKEKEETKRTLIRKLSFRPTVDELKERKIIKFSDYVEVTDANEYDRRADKPWTRLTPKDKAMIRRELNEFKSQEMAVHEDSRHLTRFHRP